VLFDPTRVGGLRDDDRLVLEGPADHDLRRRFLVALRDLADDRVSELLALRDRPVSLELDAVLPAEAEQVLLNLERVGPDLVHRAHDLRALEERLEVTDRVVADADCTDVSLFEQRGHRSPGLVAEPFDGPVDQVEIDRADAEGLDAPLARGDGRIVAMIRVP